MSYIYCVTGAANAKVIAQKAKGMPRILISLVKLLDADASEAMVKLSLELYKAYKNMHISLINGTSPCIIGYAYSLELSN